MYILLQNDALELEELVIQELLKRNKYLFNYNTHSLKEIDTLELPKEQIIVPIGTIEFVTKTLKKIDSNFTKEQPIEIPKYLQTDEFLKRAYSVVTSKDIPTYGNWFIKDASNLKNFSMVINLTHANLEDLIQDGNDYIVSSPYNIKSEYRVYVIDGDIENIALYNGDATVLPDINLVKKAVALINCHEKWLKSYSLDIMVGKEGTALIEVHNFTSLGLYNTLWGSGLIYAYRDGIDYLLNDNTIKYK